MKRIIALAVGSLLLLTVCTKQNTTVAETSPTPTLPPNRGPSAVFTATPDPNATPCPTVTFPTRDPNATPYVPKYTPYNPTPTPYTTPFPFAEIWDDIDADYTLTQEKISKMLTYRFDYDDNLDIKPQSDFTSKEEYTEFIKSECEKRYKTNVEYLKSHEINALYIKMDVGRDSNTGFEGKIYGKTTNAEEISAWKNAVLSLPAEKCSEYSIDPHRFTGGFTTITFYIDINGKIMRFFDLNAFDGLGTTYFDFEKSLYLPYGINGKKTDFFRNYRALWEERYESAMLNAYPTQSEVNLVFN